MDYQHYVKNGHCFHFTPLQNQSKARWMNMRAFNLVKTASVEFVSVFRYFSKVKLFGYVILCIK